MDVHAPAVGTDEELDRHASAMRTQLVAALTIAHPVRAALPIELRAPFTETEERSLREQERHRMTGGIEGELLNERARAFDVKGGRLRGEADRELAGIDRLERFPLATAACPANAPMSTRACRMRLLPA